MEETKDSPQRGAQFDEAMRSWAESSPARLATWLDPSVAGLPTEAFVLHSTALHDQTLRDPVIRPDLAIGISRERVMHVEYETAPRADLVDRMYDYRGRLRRDHPGRRITQHVIVLRDGQVRGHDDPDTNGFSLVLNPVYLRERDPGEFLNDPFLAPFAALARGSPAERERSLRAAITVLRECGHPLSWVWLPAAISLAEVRLEGSTVERIEKESVMSVDAYVELFRDHRWGRALISKGREEGREEGVMQERERVLLAIIRSRFGDSPAVEEAAHILGGWDDVEAAAEAIGAATDAVSLLDQIR